MTLPLTGRQDPSTSDCKQSATQANDFPKAAYRFDWEKGLVHDGILEGGLVG